MDFLFKKRKKKSQPSDQSTFTGEPTNATAGFRAEQNGTGPGIVYQDTVPGLWTSAPARISDPLPTNETGNSGIGQSELAELSRGMLLFACYLGTPLTESVAKRACKGAAPSGATLGATERFGPIKVIIGTIPAAYANDNVRSEPLVRYSPLMNLSTGIHRCHKQGRGTPLAYSGIGGTV